tara:strand:- start:2051 stop:2512 length:462 start_codon:yes stop_codon:yes gene_type:complete
MVNKKKTQKKKSHIYSKIIDANINQSKLKKNLEKDLNLITLKNTYRKKTDIQIKKDFKTIDSDKSGYIDIYELKKGLENYGIKMSIVKTKKLFKKYDNNPDNRLDYKEFVQLKKDIETGDLRSDKKKIKISFKNKKKKYTKKRKYKKKVSTKK